MATSYQILFDGAPADDEFYTSLASLEVDDLRCAFGNARRPPGDENARCQLENET